MAFPPLFLIIVPNLLFFPILSSETYNITEFEPLHDGTTLVSQPDGTFELGFFTPGSSTNRYVGIWFRNISPKTVVWVANRDSPISQNSSELSITKDGYLVLRSKDGMSHWSANAKPNGSNSNATIVANLLDTGNLVLRDEKGNNSQSYLWQSFDYPTDTLLPQMKLGWNQISGLKKSLISWKNWDNPSSAVNFTYAVKPGNNPEMAIWNGSSILYRSGPWNGIRFSGMQSSRDTDFKVKNSEYYLILNQRDRYKLMRIVINQTAGALQTFRWDGDNKNWEKIKTEPSDTCDNYNHCGPFGNCDYSDSDSSPVPKCKCLNGFKPKSPQNLSQGCVRSGNWRCKDVKKDGFDQVRNMKIPDEKSGNSWVNRSMKVEECGDICRENCSCTAYAKTEITEDEHGIGCIIWFGDLMDLRKVKDAGQDLFVRVDPSQIETKDDYQHVVVVVICTVSSLIIIMLMIFTFVYRRKRTKFREIIRKIVKRNVLIQEDLELPFFDFDTIAHATDNFSNDKKLGEGGFGPVYKGTLLDGQDIAIKRLSHVSSQGAQEFRNEVIFCSKLQHRNLVKVLGYSIEDEEQLIIYEYMPNKSLDFFLFDSSRGKLLNWSKRFNIINGIARGLLYLHEDSRLKIIHRDLKASNILLDNTMNPKISDFGLARMCDGYQIEWNTSRVVGTYGYMAPEYAINRILSIKSDVFSFGILLLEIVSGRKNKGLSYSNNSYNLVGHAWRLWQEKNPKEFIDTCLEESCILSEALRCIHIGLLCVQHHPKDRPNMSTVVVMLNSVTELPQPIKPIFLIEKFSREGDSSSGIKTYCSTNEVSFSMLEPR